MTLPLAIFIVLVAFVVLSKSADLIVKSVSHLAHLFHVSEFAIGFFILGLATSTPEIFVGINSALDGYPELSLGNLIGATIVLLTLIIGINAIVSGEIHFIPSFNAKDMWLTSFVIATPILFIFDGFLSRLDGIALIIIYAVFYLVMNRRQTFAERIENTLHNHHSHLGNALFLMVLGVIGLFVSSKFLVEAAEFLAIEFNFPLVLIGLLVISLGTNLPEFVILFKSVHNSHKQIGMGDFLGSAAANMPILGMVAIIKPITLEAPLKVYLSFGMLLVTLITFNAFFSQKHKLTRNEGFALVSLYIFFLVSEIFLKNKI